MNDPESDRRAFLTLAALVIGFVLGVVAHQTFSAVLTPAKDLPTWQITTRVAAAPNQNSAQSSHALGPRGSESSSPQRLSFSQVGRSVTSSSNPQPEESPASEPADTPSCPSIIEQQSGEVSEWLSQVRDLWPCSLSLDEYRYAQLHTLVNLGDLAKTGVTILGMLTGFTIVHRLAVK